MGAFYHICLMTAKRDMVSLHVIQVLHSYVLLLKNTSSERPVRGNGAAKIVISLLCPLARMFFKIRGNFCSGSHSPRIIQTKYQINKVGESPIIRRDAISKPSYQSPFCNGVSRIDQSNHSLAHGFFMFVFRHRRL